jgi:hypothetical protein
MLWDASAINGYAIEASDGRLGTVSDLLFEDVGWIIRWLVVDTGNWLPGRKILLPLSALGHPDQTLRHFAIKLTMQQVKESPDVDTDLPVSRHLEAHVYNSYGWDPYWSGGYFPMESGMATSIGAPLYGKTRDLGRANTQPNKGDPHLRSIALSRGTKSTPATVGSAISRISSWTMLAGASVTSKSTPRTGGLESGC